ncbi:hypothetical protein NPIL_160511 [Nephila pilipes]|uniref:Uncharacterized protein n=1 Tax=Nephila pilipes TaxID=299642 RepID=A0A8X6MVK5_NEPPI|nr:hypothetical protein NPIL_160511 [Nephila pilipes]
MWLCLLGFSFIIELLASSLSFTNNKYYPDSCIVGVFACHEDKIRHSSSKVNTIVMYNAHLDLKLTCSFPEDFLHCIEFAELYEISPSIVEKILEYENFDKTLRDDRDIWNEWYIKYSHWDEPFSLSIFDNCTIAINDYLTPKYHWGIIEFLSRYYVGEQNCHITLMKEKYGAGESLRILLMHHQNDNLECAHFDKVIDFDYFMELPSITDTSVSSHESTSNLWKNIYHEWVGYNMKHENESTSNTEKLTKSSSLDMYALPESETQKEDIPTSNIFYTFANVEPISDRADTSFVSQCMYIENEPLKERVFTPEGKSEDKSFWEFVQFVFDNSTKTFITRNSNNDHSLPAPEEYTNFLTTFGLYEVYDEGLHHFLGCGIGLLSRITDSPFKNAYCIWSNEADKLFKCSIHLTETCVFDEKNSYSRNIVFDLAFNTCLLIYELGNEIYREAATMKIEYYKPNNVFPSMNASFYIRSKRNMFAADFSSEHPRRIGKSSTAHNYSEALYNDTISENIPNTPSNPEYSIDSESHLFQFDRDPSLLLTEESVEDFTPKSYEEGYNKIKLLLAKLRELNNLYNSSHYIQSPSSLFHTRTGDMIDLNINGSGADYPKSSLEELKHMQSDTNIVKESGFSEVFKDKTLSTVNVYSFSDKSCPQGLESTVKLESEQEKCKSVSHKERFHSLVGIIHHHKCRSRHTTGVNFVLVNNYTACKKPITTCTDSLEESDRVTSNEELSGTQAVLTELSHRHSKKKGQSQYSDENEFITDRSWSQDQVAELLNENLSSDSVYEKPLRSAEKSFEIILNKYATIKIPGSEINKSNYEFVIQAFEQYIDGLKAIFDKTFIEYTEMRKNLNISSSYLSYNKFISGLISSTEDILLTLEDMLEYLEKVVEKRERVIFQYQTTLSSGKTSSTEMYTYPGVFELISECKNFRKNMKISLECLQNINS